MQYLGSKKKIAKHLLPIMLAERKSDQWWIEPFVGGANMIDKVDGKRIGNDINEYLVSLLIAIKNGYIPPNEISKEQYYLIKNSPSNYPKELVGFVGFLCSFGGKWWGGYASNKREHNYAETGSNVLCKQAKYLKDVEFRCGCYRNLNIPPNSIIYCDPPYEGTSEYKVGGKFNHDKFWQWCREMTKIGHTVFISEYKAPDDFECIKEVSTKTILNKNIQSDRVEKLFKYKR